MFTPSLQDALHRMSERQIPLPGPVAALVGAVAFVAVMFPEFWLLTRHVNTAAHEGAHALLGSSLGYKILSVTLNRDSTGLTTLIGRGGLTPLAVILVGYFGPSVFGIGAAQLISQGFVVAVLWLALLLLGLLLLTVRNLFGAFSLIVTGLLVYLIARYAPVGIETIAAYGLTWFMLLSGVRVVHDDGRDAGDAHTLAKATHIPRVLWSGAWLFGTVVALGTGGHLLIWSG